MAGRGTICMRAWDGRREGRRAGLSPMARTMRHRAAVAGHGTIRMRAWDGRREGRRTSQDHQRPWPRQMVVRPGARAQAPSAIGRRRRLSAVLRPPDQPGPSRAVAAAGGREAGRAHRRAPSATRVAAASHGTNGCKGYYSY